MRSSNERQFIRWLANQKWIKKRFVSSFNANNIIFLLWCDRFDIFGCIPSENCAIKCKLSLKGESSERLDGTTCNLIWKLLTKWLDEIKRGARANPAVIGLSYFGNPANFVCVAFWFFFFYTTKNRLYATKRLAHFILFVTSNATLFFSIFVLFSHFSSSMIFFFLHSIRKIIDWRLACLHSCYTKAAIADESTRFFSATIFREINFICVYWTRISLNHSIMSFSSMQSDNNVHSIRETILVFACFNCDEYVSCNKFVGSA